MRTKNYAGEKSSNNTLNFREKIKAPRLCEIALLLLEMVVTFYTWRAPSTELITVLL